MKKLRIKLKSIIALLLCFIMVLSNIAGTSNIGHTSFAATTTNLDLESKLNSDGSITSYWTQVPGAVEYSLLLVSSSSKTVCYANADNLQTTTYTSIANLPANQLYTIVVAAYDSEGFCTLSESVIILISSDFYSDPTPGIPAVTATSTSTSVTLSWDAVPGATSYDLVFDEITYSVPGNKKVVSVISKTLTGLLPNTSYTYSVRAKNSYWTGSYSAQKTIMTSSGSSTSLDIPTNVSATATTTSATVSWSSVSGATSYDLLFDGTIYNVTGTSKTVTGLSANTTYTYSVRAKNATGSSDYCTSKKVTTSSSTQSVPAVPTNVDATSTTNSVTVSWNAVTGATSYDVLFDGTTYSVTGTYKIITGLLPNTSYRFSVRANNAAGSSEYSTSRVVVTPSVIPKAPTVPTNLTATSTKDSVTISWSAVTGATSYDVLFDGYTNSGFGEFFNVIGTSKTFTGLTPGKKYAYAVRANNASGSSGITQTYMISTIPNPPSVPTNITATATSDSVTVKWTPVTGATSYDVMFNGTTYHVTDFYVDSASRIFAGLAPNTSYTYSVRANNSGGSGAYSTSKTVTTKMAAPTNIKYTATSNSITLSWGAVAGATSYDITWNSAVYNVTTTSKTFTGLEPFTTHGYTIRARNGDEVGPNSEFTGATTLPPAPATPTGIKVYPEDTKILITWDSVYQASDYDVIFDGKTHSVSKQSSIYITGLTPETSHTYSVRSKNTWGSSPYSETQTVTTLPKIIIITEPTTPTNVIVTPASYSITVTWSPVLGADYYDLALNGYWYHTVKGTSTTFTGLTPDGNYTVRLRAGNERGVSPYKFIEVRTLKAPPESAPEVTATATDKTVTLSWSKVKDARTYETTLDGRLSWNIEGTSNTYGGLTPDTEYTYSVCAVSEGGKLWSDPKIIRTLLSTPTNIRAVPMDEAVEISWDAVSGATSYDITFDEAAYNVSGNIGSNNFKTFNASTYNVSETSKIFTGLKSDTSYIYSVRANNAYGSSAYSPVNMVKTLGNTMEMPENVKATSTLNSVTVSWSPVEGATDYNVLFNGKTTKVTGTSKTFSGLKPNTQNRYSVRANSPLGFSSYSPAQTIFTKISKKATVQNVKSNKTYQDGKKSYTCLDPVDALTGSFIWNYTFLEDYGKDPLHFAAMYNSQGDGGQNVLGSKWTYSLNYMLYMDDEYAYFSTPNGEAVPFHINPSGSDFQLVDGIESDFTMGKKDDQTYFVRDLDGTEYQFDTNLCLNKIIEGGLVTYLFRANNEGQIISIAGQHGGILTLEYTDGHISQVSDVMGNTVMFAYDGDQMVSAQNPDGDSILFTYDDSANMLTITDFSGNNNLTNQYDSDSRVVTQNLAGRGESSALYDEENRTSTFVDELGNATIYSYDEAMHVTSVDIAGTVVQNRYNDKGQVTEEINQLGYTTKMEYDEIGRLKQVTYQDETEEHITYNDRNYPVKVVNRDGTETNYTYDGNNNVLSMQDECGNTEYFSYDSNDNLLSHTDKNGNVSTYTYDSNQNLKSYTDPEGNTYQYSYDAIGRLCSFTTPTGKTTSYDYSAAGQLLRIVDADGTVAFDYDKNGNNTGIKDRMGNSQHLEYNEMGQVSLATDYLGNEYTFIYDQRGDLIEDKDPLGYRQSYTYDAWGNVVSLTDKNGNTTSYVFDAASQLTEIKDAAGNSTKYAYDTMGQIKSVTDPRDHQTLYSYDAMGRVTEIVNALGYKAKNTYDQAGNLLTETDEDGAATTYSYDIGNRLTSITSDAGAIRFTYDKTGRLISMEDTDNHSETLSYDADGNMTKVFDKENNKTTYAYDDSGRLSEEIDSKGNKTSYKYDRNGNCTEITDAEGNVYSYQYDANDQVTKVTDPMGYTTSYIYNARGELESVTDAGGGKTTYSYDGNGNLIKEINPIGGVKTYTYDGLDQLTNFEDENGHKWSYTYDAAGNMTSYTDANQNKWTYEYDALNRITAVTDQNGDQIALSYGKRGELLTFTDQEGAQTSYQYDSLGRMTQMSDALGNCQSFVYDSLDRVVKQTDARGNVTEYEYSPAGNLLSTKDPEGNTTTYTYDSLGQVLTETDALGNVVSYAYDALGQVISITDPMGGKTSFTYTARGEIATVTDAKGKTTSYEYDANGNLSKTTNALGHVTTYEYDAMSNQIKASAPASNGQTSATIYQYDKKGQMVKEINPLSQEKTYTYDGNGNIITILDEDQYKTEVVYDLNDQPASMRYSDGKEATFRYNKRGDLVELKDWTGTVRMEYDEIGALKKVTDHNGKTVGYGYDANGNTTSIAYPDGSAVTYSYDKNDRMVKVVDGEEQVTKYEYDAIGNTLKIQQPGSTTSYAYNKNGLPIQTLYQLEDGTQLEDNLAYDAIGNIISSVKQGSSAELTEQVTYTYDALGQLLSYTKGEITESYLYDILGNRTEKRVNDSTEATYQYNQLNQLISKVENGITSSYQYDKRGNQIEEKNADQVVKQYIYDATNHMVLGRNIETGEKSEYTYNGLYMRVKNVQMLEQHRFSYENYGQGVEDENQPEAFRVKETNYVIDYLSDTNNELLSIESDFGTTRVTYGRGSERLNQKLSIFPETKRTLRTDIAEENSKVYFQSDRSGSVLFASNQEGEVLRYAPRDVWGNLQIPVEDDISCAGLENSFGFTNYMYDTVLDKYFAQARFYDGETARMISKDTYWDTQNNIYGDDAATSLLPDTNAIRQSMNPYAYALNNPVCYYDPSGFLARCQYKSFAWEFGKEAVKITLDNTLLALPRFISDAKEFVASMNEFIKGKYSLADIKDALGQSVWDGLSGDLRFVFSHLDWYKVNKKLTDEQVKELAQRSARAYEEGVQIIMTAVMAVKSVTAIKGKLSVTLKQKGGNVANKRVNKRGPNVKKATKGGTGTKGAGDLKITSGNLKHITNEHSATTYAKQLPYKSQADVLKQLETKSFFNSSWSNSQIESAVNSGYNQAVSQGITNGKLTFTYAGESVTVALENGAVQSAWGNYTYTYQQLLDLLK